MGVLSPNSFLVSNSFDTGTEGPELKLLIPASRSPFEIERAGHLDCETVTTTSMATLACVPDVALPLVYVALKFMSASWSSSRLIPALRRLCQNERTNNDAHVPRIKVDS